MLKEILQPQLNRFLKRTRMLLDACPNACKMWKAIKRLKQGESINVQDLETNLFLEFGKFTSLDGESLESYYSRHVARECQKPKRVKDAAYHREKMLLCKQEEAGIQLNAEQADWKDDTDDESDDQELEAHYMYMAKLQQYVTLSEMGKILTNEGERDGENLDKMKEKGDECIFVGYST
nr:hypothetical protein [Tanacetum cinerariifolium]